MHRQSCPDQTQSLRCVKAPNTRAARHAHDVIAGCTTSQHLRDRYARLIEGFDTKRSFTNQESRLDVINIIVSDCLLDCDAQRIGGRAGPTDAACRGGRHRFINGWELSTSGKFRNFAFIFVMVIICLCAVAFPFFLLYYYTHSLGYWYAWLYVSPFFLYTCIMHVLWFAFRRYIRYIIYISRAAPLQHTS